MLSSICASRRSILAWVKFRSRVLTALNLLPSIATLATGEEFKAPAQHHKLTADPPDGLAIVLPEVGYCLEVRHQAAGQPNHLDIALALPLQPPARLHPIEISVDVNLQQRRRVIGRPSCRFRCNAPKAQRAQIKLIDKDGDRPDWIVLAQIVTQPLGNQRARTAIIANHKTPRRILPPESQ